MQPLSRQVWHTALLKRTYDSKICGRKKNVNVLLPAGYTTAKKYPVLYVLHGYWGNEDALLDAGDASLRLRQIIGNGIDAGEAKEMIVVFPDICASTTQDKCTGLDAQNGTMHIWHTVTGGDHGGKTIRPHMYNYIRAIFHAS